MPIAPSTSTPNGLSGSQNPVPKATLTWDTTWVYSTWKQPIQVPSYQSHIQDQFDSGNVDKVTYSPTQWYSLSDKSGKNIGTIGNEEYGNYDPATRARITNTMQGKEDTNAPLGTQVASNQTTTSPNTTTDTTTPAKPNAQALADSFAQVGQGEKKGNQAIVAWQQAENTAYTNAVNADNQYVSDQQASTQRTIGTEEQYYAGVQAQATARTAQLNAENTAYASQKQKEIDQATTIQQPLIDAEKAQNAAAIQYAQQKEESDIQQAKAQSYIDQQNAIMTASIHGGAMSGGMINQITKISSQGIQNLATIQSKSNLDIASLKVQATQIEINHQQKLQDYISQANEQILTHTENTTSKISDIQNNVLLTEKQKNDAINKTLDDFSKTKRGIEDDLLSKARTHAQDTISATNDLQKNIDAIQTKRKDYLTNMITSGQANNITPQMEVQAWVPVGSSTKMMNNQISSLITKALDSTWATAWVTSSNFSSSEIVAIQTNVISLIKQGYSMETAVKMSINDIAKNKPEIASALERMQASSKTQQNLATIYKNEATAGMNVAKTDAIIDKTPAEVALLNSKTLTDEEKRRLTSAQADTQEVVAKNKQKIIDGEIARSSRPWASKGSSTSALPKTWVREDGMTMSGKSATWVMADRWTDWNWYVANWTDKAIRYTWVGPDSYWTVVNGVTETTTETKDWKQSTVTNVTIPWMNDRPKSKSETTKDTGNETDI